MQNNELDPAIAGTEQLAAAKELLKKHDMDYGEGGAEETDTSGLADGEIF